MADDAVKNVLARYCSYNGSIDFGVYDRGLYGGAGRYDGGVEDEGLSGGGLYDSGTYGGGTGF